MKMNIKIKRMAYLATPILFSFLMIIPLEARGAAHLTLKYSCQVGEKPGSPNYKLEITDTDFKISKNAPLFQKNEIIIIGKLKDKDLGYLKNLFKKMNLPKEELHKKINPEGIEGFCSLIIRDSSKELNISTGEKNIIWANYQVIFDWISELHKNHPKLSGIQPIFPVSPQSPPIR